MTPKQRKIMHLLQIIEIVLVIIVVVFGFIYYAEGFVKRATFCFVVVFIVAVLNIIVEVLKWK